MLVTECAHRLQVVAAGRDNAPFTLDRLQHHRTGGIGHSRFQCGQVLIGHMADAAHGRAETFGILGLTADTDGKQRATVEAVGAGDDLVLGRTTGVMPPAARQLEGRLVGLGTGVGKKHPLGKGGLHQLVGQAQRRLVGHDVGDVPQLAGLFGQCLNQGRVCMAQCVHRNTARQVNVFSAFLVPQTRARAANRNHIHRCVIGNHNPIKIGPTDRC